MKVLHLSQNDSLTGAGKAAYRLHVALKSLGVDSHMWVQNKYTDDPTVTGRTTKISRLVPRIKNRFTQQLLRLQKTPNIILHSLNIFPSGLAGLLNRSPFDIIHLHWINDEMISLRELGALQKPLCWTFHDSWPFCGAEHHPLSATGDIRIRNGYTRNNKPAFQQGLDWNRYIWNRKRCAWRFNDLQVVTPSKWLSELARSSSLFRRIPVATIPNTLNTRIFSPRDPRDPRDARTMLGLPENKKIILTYHITGKLGWVKGDQQFWKKLTTWIRDKPSWQVVVFGDSPAQAEGIKNLGYISGDQALAEVYRAADVVIFPSRIDNFPNIVLEALSCGTPVIAFWTGGIPELIDNEENGILIDPFNTDRLFKAAEALLSDVSRLRAFQQAARRKILSLCSPGYVAHSYFKLYQTLRIT